MSSMRDSSAAVRVRAWPGLNVRVMCRLACLDGLGPMSESEQAEQKSSMQTAV